MGCRLWGRTESDRLKRLSSSSSNDSVSKEHCPTVLHFLSFHQVVPVVKNPSANAGGIRDTGSIPWVGKISFRRAWLHHPWDSPGKNTGVGCHFLLQCMKVKRESEVTQSCPTLRDAMDCSPPGSSVYGIFQAGVLEWGATAFSNYCTVILLSYASKVMLKIL